MFSFVHGSEKREEIMRFMALMLPAVAIQTDARAGQVTVYVQDFPVAPVPVLSRAQTLANEIFARASVKIDWRRGAPSQAILQYERPILVEMASHTPSRLSPGALAFSLPTEGVRITVFYDRVQEATASDNPTADVLPDHVLVHEITHILQGTCRHTGSGVMKVLWTQKDIRGMSRRPLAFTKEDVRLIETGLARRADARTLIAATPVR